jgi:hypothetical protein
LGWIVGGNINDPIKSRMIYFIVAKNYVKIGCSEDPEIRLKELQTSNPNKLKLIATMPGSFQTESELHCVFARFRARGEWFRYDGHLKASILAINDNGTETSFLTVKAFQRAGLHLQIRQKANKLKRKGKYKLYNRLKNS